MKRIPLLVMMLVIVGAAFMLYRVKYEVQALQQQIVESERELAHEREALRVVSAEWAYLNRPERLRQLAAKYLSSGSLTVEQIAEIEAIPFPRQVEASLSADDNIRPASLNHKEPELEGAE